MNTIELLKFSDLPVHGFVVLLDPLVLHLKLALPSCQQHFTGAQVM